MGTNFTGTGYFKFAIVRLEESQPQETRWSNSGNVGVEGEPTVPIPVGVHEGLFRVALGGEATAALTPEVFLQPDLGLRIWFSVSESGPFQALAPVQPLSATPFAWMAAQASNVVGVLPASALRGVYDGAVTFSNALNVFVGSGAGLHTLNAEALATGTVPDAQLSANVAFKVDATNAVNHFVTSLRSYDVRAFGARGDGRVGQATILSGSTNLTVAAGQFTVADVGKIISVTGAGAGSNNLVTTITSVAAADSIGLADAAAVAVTDYPMVYGTDDTAAIQAGLDYTTTNGGGTLYFPLAVYLIAGPLRETATHNSQLRFPEVAPVGQNANTVKLLGPQAPAARQGGVRSPSEWTTSGATLWSTLPQGGGGSVLSCWNFTNPSYITPDSYFNALRVEVENLAFRCPPNPDRVCLQLAGAASARLRSVFVDTGWPEYFGPVPTHTNSAAVHLPGRNNAGGGSLRVEDCIVAGFYSGFLLNEHAAVDGCCAYGCQRAYWLYAGGHEISMVNCNAEGCKTAIYANDWPVHLSCYGLSVENSFGGWWSPPVLLSENSHHVPTQGKIVSGFIEYTFTTRDEPLQIEGGARAVSIRRKRTYDVPALQLVGKCEPNRTFVKLDGGTNGSFILDSNCVMTVRSGLLSGTLAEITDKDSNPILSVVRGTTRYAKVGGPGVKATALLAGPTESGLDFDASGRWELYATTNASVGMHGGGVRAIVVQGNGNVNIGSSVADPGVRLNVQGPCAATLFSGIGSNLTALSASALSSGLVPLARLSGITSNQLDAATDAAYRATGGLSQTIAVTVYPVGTNLFCNASAGTFFAATLTNHAILNVTNASPAGFSDGELRRIRLRRDGKGPWQCFVTNSALHFGTSVPSLSFGSAASNATTYVWLSWDAASHRWDVLGNPGGY